MNSSTGRAGDGPAGLRGASAAAGALDECLTAGDHAAVTRCLLEADAQAQASLRNAEGDAGKRAREIDTATGRSGANAALAKSLRAVRRLPEDAVRLRQGAVRERQRRRPGAAGLPHRPHAPARARTATLGIHMSITIQEALQRTIEHREIFHDEMLSLMRQIMSGEVSPVMIAALTVGLRVKKETIGEIAAAAQVMRELSTKVEVPDREHLVDIVGTGGDASHTFNISTASMFVAAGAGARVAKHGGRSVSSKSGSADVLEALGANIMLTPAQVATCIAETGVGFMFAPNHHAAMKHAGPVRKELGVRTIFNILGPLTNPAGAPNQLIGVFHPDLVGIHVRVLQRLGAGTCSSSTARTAWTRSRSARRRWSAS